MKALAHYFDERAGKKALNWERLRFTLKLSGVKQSSVSSTILKKAPSGTKFQPQLSGLRICGVFFVMCFHYSTHMMNFRDKYDLGSLIVFFFVLSSYLITRILLNTKDKSLAEGIGLAKVAGVYIYRRTLRIFPPYYFYLIILMLIPVAGAEARAHAGMYFSYLSNFQLFHLKTWDTFTVHFWTLSVEEQFYISWPWLILFVPNKKLPFVFGSLIAVAVFFRIIMTAMMTDRLLEIFPMLVLTPSCLDSFAIGALVALAHHNGYLRTPMLKTAAYALIPVWLFLIFSKTAVPLFIGIDRLVITLLSVLIIEKANLGYKGVIKVFLENRIIQYLSKISYGIYIWHMLSPLFVTWAIVAIQQKFGTIPWLQQPGMLHRSAFLFCVLTAIGCASVSWYLLELPLNRLKNAYLYLIPKSKRTASGNKNEPEHTETKANFTG